MAPEMKPAEVMTAREKKIEDSNRTIKHIVDSLCYRWDLNLEIPRTHESPGTRADGLTMEQRCVSMIKVICFKDTEAMYDIERNFQQQAEDFYNRWVKKPRAERGVVPQVTRSRPHPLTSGERQQLLQTLHTLLQPVAESIKQAKTPRRFHPDSTKLNDTPVPFPLRTGSSGLSNDEVTYPQLEKSSAESKRSRDEPFEDISPIKKAKPYTSQARANNAMPPPPGSFPSSGKSVGRDSLQTKSANTSFQSDAPSIFSRRASFAQSTQDTIPDEDPNVSYLDAGKRPSAMTQKPDNAQISSTFEHALMGLQEEEIIDTAVRRGSMKSYTESKRPRKGSPSGIRTKKPKADALQSRSINSMPPRDTGRGRSRVQEENHSRSNETSSVWSAKDPNSLPQSTQATDYNDEPTLPERDAQPYTDPQFTNPQPEKKSSSYQSSSFEARVADLSEDEVIISNNDTVDADEPATEKLSQDLNEIGLDDENPAHPTEQQLRDGLANVFPKLPRIFRRAPLPVLYEITRVFLHVNVPLSELNAPVTDELLEYEKLWSFLNILPELRGHTFPERCAEEVWKTAVNGFEKGIHCVVLAGKLTFNKNLDPPFQLRLDPMKLDESHRIDRRWGSDRSLELTVPELSGSKIPAVMRIHEKKIGPERWREIIIDWLVTSSHLLFGRSWQPFGCKPTERPKKKPAAGSPRLDTYRVNLFALDGPGFMRFRNPGNASKADRPSMSIDQFIDSIRPTKENEHQTYLKLFNRTVLALSRNQATLVLEEDQIRRRQKDIREEDIIDGIIHYGAAPGRGKPNGPVMNDGAGRISRTLAAKVKDKLALTYTPSAFQGRLGGAKGLWVVDYNDNSNTDWIEVYPSQQKWDLKGGVAKDPSHRTFEVNGISGPLKSADLNTQFLPLLVNGARDKTAMKASITELLKQGLRQKLDDIQSAIDEPQNFKKWIRESNANLKEKLKFGGIPCLAGLPVTGEERLNLLLDAGFLPRELLFMKEETLKLFTFRTDDLKNKMNITVGKSCFAYMVPDFWGVLEPDEVYIDFSSFKDDTSGFSGVVLRDDYVLVARSPAHFASDIQKVKAVVKPEFLGLKDVIVFPIKGNPSLADKLSGGDYDGDRAWVCWEEDIVNNFDPTEPLSQEQLPNLVEENFLSKDARIYKDLVKDQHDQVSVFLKAAFDFNMRPSKLGICTNFKESVFYTLKNASDPRNVALCKLLSDLVDQAKNGYGFSEDSWKRFKKEKVIIKPRQPCYSTGVVDDCKKSDHILDHLTYIAHQLVDKAVQEFHDNFQQPPSWDDDLVICYNWAYGLAKSDPAWGEMLDALTKKLKSLKHKWSSFHWKTAEESEISAFKINLYEDFKNIRPPVDNTAGISLLGHVPDHDLSQWHLLKASTLFAIYRGRAVSNLVWWMSAKQLCHMKAMQQGTPHSVIPGMYILMKPDNNMIRRMESMQSYGRNLEEMASVVNAEELEDLDDD